MQATGGYAAGHEADPSDGEIAGGPLGRELLERSETALSCLIDVRSREDKLPLSAYELRAMAVVCKAIFKPGSAPSPEEQYVIFASKTEAHFKTLGELEHGLARRRAAAESQSKAAA